MVAEEQRAPDQPAAQTCRVCATPVRRHTFDVRGYRYYRCKSCGTLFVGPLPTMEELASFYNSTYRVDRAAIEAGLSRKWPRLVRIVSSYVPAPGRLLEIGCSWGGFLVAARDAGWDVTGVDLSEEAVSHVRAVHGIKAWTGPFESSPFINERFDLIVFWHLIEHHRVPSAFLSLVTRCLSSRGAVAFTTPNADSAAARLGGPFWEWLTPPEHLHLFGREGIRRLLEGAALAPVKMTTRRGDARPFAAEVFISLAKRLEEGLRPFRNRQEARASIVPGGQIDTGEAWKHRAAEGAVRITRYLTPPLGIISGAAYGWCRCGPEWLVIARPSG